MLSSLKDLSQSKNGCLIILLQVFTLTQAIHTPDSQFSEGDGMQAIYCKKRLTCLFGLMMLSGMYSVSADTPTPQVLIESKIIEVDDSFLRDIGTKFDGLNSCLEQGELQRQSLGPKPSFAESAGASITSGLMGSLFGGGIGAGSGGDSGPDQTFLSDNRFTF